MAQQQASVVAAGQQPQYSYEVGGGNEQQQAQPGAQAYPLEPGMQTFGSDGNNNGDDGEHDENTGHTGTSSTPSRQVNPSKRAEQNRKAQRAFRERRDA